MHNLEKVFDFQESLMNKLRPVEVELGYSPPIHPLDLGSRRDQDWFRLMSWYTTEEIVETLTAPLEEQPEELADILHFATELCILAGVTVKQVTDHFQADMFKDAPWQFTLTDVLISLGSAVNLLKAKHWKRNPQTTDPDKFQFHLSLMLYKLLAHIKARGLDYSEIYFAKHKKNEDRIQTQY